MFPTGTTKAARTFTNKDLDTNKLPDGLTPDVGDNQLPDGLVPDTSDEPSFKGEGFNPAGDYLKKDYKVPYTGDPNRQPADSGPDTENTVTAGLARNVSRLVDPLLKIGKEAGPDILAGKYPHSLDALTDTFTKPFGSGEIDQLRQHLAKPTNTAGEVTRTGLDMAGLPATDVWNDIQKGHYRSAIGDALGTAALIGLTHKLGTPGETPSTPLEEVGNNVAGEPPTPPPSKVIGSKKAATRLAINSGNPNAQVIEHPSGAGYQVVYNKTSDILPSPPPTPTPAPVAEPKQSSFLATDEKGNVIINKKNGSARLVNLPNPQNEFDFEKTEPFTSGAKQQQLTNVPEPPEPKTQGTLDLQNPNPRFSDKFRQNSLYPTPEGGLNEDMPPSTEEPNISTENKSNVPVEPHPENITNEDWNGIQPDSGSRYESPTKVTPEAIVDSLPDAKDGTKVSPFPKADDSVLDEMIRNKQVNYDNPHLEDVPLHNLVGTQDTVDPNIVKHYVGEGDREPLTEVPNENKGRMDDKAPVVIRVGNENVLAGGHHRATADLVNGKDTMQAVVYHADVPPDLLAKFKESLEKDRAGDLTHEPIEDNPNLHTQEMTATEHPGNVAVGGADERVVRMIGQNLYSGDRPSIAIKELMQNVVDEHKAAGTTEPIKVLFQHADVNPATGEKAASLAIKDKGRGLNEKQLRTVFTDIGKSGKASEESAAGGFGVAKAAPMLGGKYSKFESVVNENGKKVKYTFEGTPDQLQNQKIGVPLKGEEVPADTPTGLKAKVYYDDLGSAPYMAKDMGEESYGTGSPIHISDTYRKLDPGEEDDYFNSEKGHLNSDYGKKVYEPNSPQELQDVIHTPTADIHMHYETPKDSDAHQDYRLDVANKGLHQYSSTDHYSPFGALRNVPGVIKANVISKIAPDEPGYPFTMNREQLDKSVSKQIDQWIQDNVVSGALQKQRASLQEMYKGMTPIPQRGATFRPTVLFDPHDLLEPGEKQEMLKSPVIQKLSGIIDGFVNRSLESTDQPTWINRLKKTGITLDPKVHGIHIPNPDAPDSTILLNPFNAIRMFDDPEEAARDIAGTILHEVGHVGQESLRSAPIDWSNINKEDPNLDQFFKKYFEDVAHGNSVRDAGHGMNWLRNLAEVYSKSGNELFNQAVGDITNAITEPGESGSRDYSEQVQKLLQIYSDRSGRTGSEADILSRTGVQSKFTGASQDDIQHDAGLNGESSSGNGNALSQEFNRPIKWSKTTNGKVESEAAQAHPAESQNPQIIKQIKQTIPQSELPNRIVNISNHLDEALSQKKVPLDEKEGLISKALNFQRTLLTSMNLHAPGRQGLPLIWNKAWWTSWTPMLKSYGSEGAYQNVMASIANHPSGLFKKMPKILADGTPSTKVFQSFADKAGLDLTDALSNREEIFRSQLAEKYVPGVRPSVRAYTAYLNKLRSDVFANMVKQAGAENDIPTATKIADFVNVATGRGNLGAFEPASKGIAQIFFSPRKMAADAQMFTRTLNPMWYAKQPPVVRMAQLKSAISTAGTGLLLGSLAKNVGATVDDDPDSTDYGKIRFGNTRIDPFAGHQQYLVAAARLLQGKTTSSFTGKTHQLNTGKFGSTTGQDIATRFLANKLAPVPAMVWNWMGGKEFDGTPFDIKREVLEHTAPLVGQDLWNIWKENPDIVPASIMSGSAGIGFGVQTYGR